MMTSNFGKITALTVAVGISLSTGAFAGPRDERPEGKEDKQTKWFFLTGSLIPQKVKVKSSETATTTSPVRAIKRREIDQSGRFTTEEILAREPGA